jgi:Domain of unknown function (DUF4105)
MNIKSSLINTVRVGQNSQNSRRDDYRSEIKVSPQDKQDHLDINWRADQTPSQLVSKNGSEYTVTNFRWGFEESGEPNDWAADNRNATIDASKVKNVYLAIEPFAPEVVAGHGLMVFEMEKDGAVAGPDGKTDYGFAVSVEARKPVGTEYGLMKGMKKSFGMIYQLGSLSDQLQKVTRQRGHKLVLHRIDLNDEQKKEMAHNALDASVEDRLGEWYHTLTNSCFTASVDLVNGVVPDKQKMARWTDHLRFSRLNTSLPALAGATLRSKGLLAREPITFLKPNPELWPDKQTGVSGLQKVLASASKSFLFKPAFAVAGAASGGALGHVVGSLFGEFAGVAGTVIGAVSGLGTGSYMADFTAAKSDQKAENAVQWYAENGGLTSAEAERRISHA